MYHGIILCGSRNDWGGRNIAGYRLRTSAAQAGYNVLIVDCATAMTGDELFNLLSSIITPQTIFVGFSTVWLERPRFDKPIQWTNSNFFGRFKKSFSNVKIIAGGNGVLRMPGAREIYDASDWHVSGFSDDSFPKLIMLLEGKSGHGLKYFVDENGKKTVDSNRFHVINHPDDIETVFLEEDNFASYQPLPLEVSRGCIFRCAFCNHPFQGAKDYDSYMRTPESLARELRRNYELFGSTRYSVMDDTFNDTVEKLERLERAIEIAKLPDFKFQCYIKPEMLVTKPQMVPKLLNMGLVGGFVGIESLNNQSRRAMNKGMNIDRVFKSLNDLTATNQVKLHGGFIVGLPEDSIDDLHKTYDYCVSGELFRSWYFSCLGIYTYTEVEKNSMTISPLEKEPEKYGYTIESTPGQHAIWKNRFMDARDGFKLAATLNENSEKYIKCGGWSVSSAWHNNETDDNIENMTVMDLNLDDRGRVLVRDRAIETINRYTR
jgi:radical SAM superfamily enzyme YgiQ (UPF0313 family)